MKKLIFLLIIAAFTANVSAATTESDNYKPKKHKKHKKNKKHRKLGVCYGLGSLPKTGR
jgi:hypothetical protein